MSPSWFLFLSRLASLSPPPRTQELTVPYPRTRSPTASTLPPGVPSTSAGSSKHRRLTPTVEDDVEEEEDRSSDEEDVDDDGETPEDQHAFDREHYRIIYLELTDLSSITFLSR